MTAQHFLISNFEIGLERDLEPFLIPETAFPTLEDAFVFRGRVERRPGFLNQGRLRRILANKVNPINLAQLTAAALTTTIPDLLNDAAINLRVTEPNAEIQPGTVEIIEGFLGSTWDDTTTNGVMTATGGQAADGTINYATGQIVLNFTVPQPGGNFITLLSLSYYPSFPVMGLRTREQQAINQEQTVAFDTIYAYRFVLPGGWEELPSNVATTWNGNDSQFFWTANYRGTVSSEQFFWVTNFNQAIGGGDPIYYYDPNAAPATWTAFAPPINVTGDELHQCRIILPFKDRLVCFDTWEGATLAGSIHFPQRARWSQNGDPTTVAPAASSAWLDTVVGRGGFIDAPVSEEIITVQFIKDRLIVFFERSTWEFVYTGNEILPFIWQQINSELGAESTFSEVGFDDGVLGIGNTGIHVANTSGVERIDLKIPDEVVKINNSNAGTDRVYGIRDFNKELIYWTLPSFVDDPIYPNRVIVYNYRNNTFAFFNDRFTCYGYFQRTTGYTWATLPYSTWSSWTVPWNAGIGQSFYPQVIAGNQQGFTHLFDDSITNDVSLSVTAIAGNLVTSPNHNLQEEQYVKFEDLTGITITPVGHASTTYLVLTVPSANTFTIDGNAAGVYPGGGFINVLNNIDIRTKNFAFFMAEDTRMLIDHTEWLFTKTSDGEVNLEFYQDFNDVEALDVLRGTKAVRTSPEDNDNFAGAQNKIWHRSARPLICDTFQAQINLSDAQMRDDTIQESDIKLHGILINAAPAGGGVQRIVSNTDNSNAASDAFYHALTGGASGGDPYIHFEIDGIVDKSIGFDNSDSDQRFLY